MSTRRRKYKEYLNPGSSHKVSRQTSFNRRKELTANSSGNKDLRCNSSDSSEDEFTPEGRCEQVPMDLTDESQEEDCEDEDILEHSFTSEGSLQSIQETSSDEEVFSSSSCEEGYDDDEVKGDSKLEEKILPKHEMSKFDVLLMILHLTFRHGLTFIALQDILKFVNTILGGTVLPESVYLINKIFQTDIKPVFHFYCSLCQASITQPDKETSSLPCAVCGTVCNFKSLNNGNFFLTLPIKAQIKSLLENKLNIFDLLKYRKECVNDDTYRDIFDGSGYKNLVDNDILSDTNNLSITLNTDGSPVFKSVKNTMWPIQFRLNELPPRERFLAENLMLAGVWFGKSEPNMTLFLKPFLEEACDMYYSGFTWKHMGGTFVKSKVVLLNCVLDSVAKPTVQSTTQFNGYYGCGYCYHPGTSVSQNNGRPQIRYSAVEIYNERTDAEIRRDMHLSYAQNNRVVKGVKGLSPLIVYPVFNLVFGFIIDYMHAVLLGVAKLTANLWLDSKFHNNDYYIGLRTKEIDKRLLHIKPPQSISRRPRSIEDRGHWKANEWRSWLLYYSLPCLVDILPQKYIKHHCLLVSAIFILLQDHITVNDLNDANTYLIHYVRGFEKLYGSINMKFNVHLLLHLCSNVKLWGPLWCYSAFSFEAGNGSLVKLVKGTKGVASQIAQKYMMLKSIPRLTSIYNVGQKTVDFCSELMSFSNVKNVTRCNETVLLGDPVSIPFTAEQQNLILQEGLSFSQFCYNRMVHKGIKYHSKIYKKCKKSDDSIVKLIDKSYGVIERIMTIENGGSMNVFILLRMLSIGKNEKIVAGSSGSKASHIKVCNSYAYGGLCLKNVDFIHQKSILMNLLNSCYVTDFPNLYEKD